MLKEMVTAFNVTDSAGSIMTMAPIGVSHLLLDRGIETILQITCRDRNRMAIQSNLLAVHALGVSNLLCMTGDPPGGGDHPDARSVFDLDAMGLLRAAQALNSGTDLAGNELTGVPEFCPGAVANPGARDLDKEIGRMEDKIEAGALFFQTQAVYDLSTFERFINKAQRFKVPVLAGLIVLKSAEMARNLNDKLPGVFVPAKIIQEMDDTSSQQETSVEIVARIIREIQQMCRGVHIMAIGWEAKIPRILEAAGLAGREQAHAQRKTPKDLLGG
jgi:5,10-methylenetetrahydrofolate reductase